LQVNTAAEEERLKPTSIIAIERWWSVHRHTLSVWIPAASLVLFLVTATLFIVATVATTIFLIGDAGYGATATGVQAGANINYYFECLFALVPLAALGT
jgi:hypothetical protein